MQGQNKAADCAVATDQLVSDAARTLTRGTVVRQDSVTVSEAREGFGRAAMIVFCRRQSPCEGLGLSVNGSGKSLRRFDARELVIDVRQTKESFGKNRRTPCRKENWAV
jgi:hypothetical protein